MRFSTKALIAGLVVSSILLIANGASAQRPAASPARSSTRRTPIEGVTITISAEVLSREIVKLTNKKGKFTVSHSDATMTYEYKFEKDGLSNADPPGRARRSAAPIRGVTRSCRWRLLPRPEGTLHPRAVRPAGAGERSAASTRASRRSGSAISSSRPQSSPQGGRARPRDGGSAHRAGRGGAAVRGLPDRGHRSRSGARDRPRGCARHADPV